MHVYLFAEFSDLHITVKCALSNTYGLKWPFFFFLLEMFHSMGSVFIERYKKFFSPVIFQRDSSTNIEKIIKGKLTRLQLKDIQALFEF